MKVLVTGANGFIGRHLCGRLAAKHHVLAVTRSAPPARVSGVDYIVADLTERFESILPAPMDVVISLAQSPHYREFPARAEDVFAVNVQSLARLLDWSRTNGVQRFIYASSANVYAQASRPIRETDAVMPTSFYARTKIMAEMLVESYADCFACLVMRLFTIYGAGQRAMLISNLIERVLSNVSVRVEGERGLLLSPLYVGDLCAVMEASLFEPSLARFSVMNVGGDETLGIRDMASSIARASGASVQFHEVSGPQPQGWVADTTRLRQQLALAPFLSFAEGIERTVHAAVAA